MCMQSTIMQSIVAFFLQIKLSSIILYLCGSVVEFMINFQLTLWYATNRNQYICLWSLKQASFL